MSKRDSKFLRIVSVLFVLLTINVILIACGVVCGCVPNEPDAEVPTYVDVDDRVDTADTKDAGDTTDGGDADATTDDTAEVCVPDCGNAVCGTDGCGGSCGLCSDASPVCVAGQCATACDTVADCDNTNECRTATCAGGGCFYSVASLNGTHCEDGNICTLADKCLEGACEAGSLAACDDGNICTTDSCDPATGCVYSNNTADCDDGIACTTEVCKDGFCATTADNSACDDGNVCTTDFCDKLSGCAKQTVSGCCNSSTSCAAGEVCINYECVAEPPVCTPDCAVKSCGLDGCGGNCGVCVGDTGICVSGSCVECIIPSDCAAGESCKSWKCVVVDPCEGKSCNDANACTKDSCVAGECQYVSKTCGVSQVCNVVTGVCENTNPCAGKVCEDNNPCTIDSCSSSTGACVFSTKAECCNVDGDCGAGEACSDGKCSPVSQPDPPPSSKLAWVTVKWPTSFSTTHVALQGWFCKDGTYDWKTGKITGCTNAPEGSYDWEWKEWFTWDSSGASFSSPSGSFKLPHGGWFVFNVKYQTAVDTPFKWWCDSSPDGFSTGVEVLFWVGDTQCLLWYEDNGAAGCNAYVYIP